MSDKPVFFRNGYNYDPNQVSGASGLSFDPAKDRTHQSFKDECDINTIVKRFGIGEQLPSGMVAPSYADFEGVVDFHTAMNAIAQARESFDSLPADVRQRFNHDPGQFVDFCSDAQNLSELEKLGLVVRNVSPKTAYEDESKAAPIPTHASPSSNAA